jgi:hypothetical protein
MPVRGYSHEVSPLPERYWSLRKAYPISIKVNLCYQMAAAAPWIIMSKCKQGDISINKKWNYITSKGFFINTFVPVKKILVTILALVYLTASIGATVHMHYCMDKLVSWGFAHQNSDDKSCSYCGMKKTPADKNCSKEVKGCCKDEHKQLRLEKDQKVSEYGFDFNKLISQSTVPSLLEIYKVSVFSPTLTYPLTHAPPPGIKPVSLFVLNCVFRI